MEDFIIEAQQIPGPERHSYILNSFDNLEAGQSLVIINNHDPIPLLNQFHQSKKDQFSHSYLEEGPTTWKLKITKIKKEGCCGFCT